MKVLGMIKENYVGQVCEGHNCEFTYKYAELERHHLYLQNNGVLYELSLEVEYGQCGSGWTTAEEVLVKLKEISELPENMVPCKLDKEYEMLSKDTESYSCDLFSFTVYGGDHYYPCGHYTVFEDLFGKK